MQEPLTPAPVVHRRVGWRAWQVLATLLVLLSSHGCAWILSPFRGAPPPLLEIDTADAPLLIDDLDPGSLRTAIEASVSFYDREAGATFAAGVRTYTGTAYATALRALLSALPASGNLAALDAALRSGFDLLRATGQGRPIRFTGYYAPILQASFIQDGLYQYPLYARPPDLVCFKLDRIVPGCDCASGERWGRLQDGVAVPYYARADIDSGGALRGYGLEIAWTDDPIALFFLHIQGSGQLALPDGRRLYVNYAGTNGRPYRSVGLLLADRGMLPPRGGSMQAVRAYLAEHPLERDELLSANERYTFFRIADEGPFGSTQVQLTDGRSIATDPAFFPPGSLAYIRTRVPVANPDGTLRGWAPLQRLVLNQDQGTAIKGPARVDIYFGAGKEAEAIAGRMSAEGEVYVLVPRLEALARTVSLPTVPEVQPGRSDGWRHGDRRQPTAEARQNDAAVPFPQSSVAARLRQRSPSR